MRSFITASVLCFLAMLLSSVNVSADDLSFTAGNPNAEIGIKFYPMAPMDGNAKLVTQTGKQCLKTDIKSLNPYIYFDVNRKELLKFGYPPYSIQMEIEYLDQGTDSLAIQYDSKGNEVSNNYKEIAWNKTSTGLWKTKTLLIKDAEFNNGQQGISDFRLCSGTDGDDYFAKITISVLKAAKTNPRVMLSEQKIGKKSWTTIPIRIPVIVAQRRMSEPETIALEKLCLRFEYLGASKPEILNALPSPDHMQSGKDYIIVGKMNESQLRNVSSETENLVEEINQVKDTSQRDQSYILITSNENKHNIVTAVGKGTMGSVFAMAHIETHLWTDGSKLSVHLDKPQSVEIPGFKQRELYINIGYGLTRDRITPDTWSLQDWKNYIDKLVLARFSAWSFYLWGDSEFAYPASSVNKEKNIRVHKTIQEAIRYAHQRGLQVGYHMSPTMIPEDILAKQPELKATLEYPANGIVCPSKPASWDLMIPVYTNEIEWFKECDFFPIWFYDCGGCFCDQCVVPEQQLKTIVKQVEVFDKIIHQNNPKAVTQVVTWAIWRYERMHKYFIREKFMDEMDRIFAGRKNQCVISDGIYIDPGVEALFPLAKKHGFESKSFLYQTNIEDGQPFAMPMTRYFEKWVPESVKVGASQIHLMRMECQTKYPQDFVGGYLFWNPKDKGNAALRLYSMYTAGDSSAGNKLYQAMLDMDDFSWFGYQGCGADKKQGIQINNLINSAVSSLPTQRADDLEWLVTTGAGYRVLGKAIEAKDTEDQETADATIAEFKRALINSPTFKAQVDSDIWLNLYKIWYIKDFHQGWASNHF